MKNLSIDIETYCSVDLSKCGVYKYVESDDFEILLFASLGMLIAFITHGIYFFGPFLIVIGLIIMASTILSYIFNSTVIEKGGDE